MRIFIAGPYSKGDVVVNVQNAIHAANKLLALGHTPFIPHLTHFWHLITPKPYEEWVEIDKAWLYVCDALLRLPGESPGADNELEIAKCLNLTIYMDIECTDIAEMVRNAVADLQEDRA